MRPVDPNPDRERVSAGLAMRSLAGSVRDLGVLIGGVYRFHRDVGWSRHEAIAGTAAPLFGRQYTKRNVRVDMLRQTLARLAMAEEARR